MELTKIEERKKVRVDKIEFEKKRKAKAEQEIEEPETVTVNKSQQSPSKVAFNIEKSSVSSPTKMSPKKSYA